MPNTSCFMQLLNACPPALSYALGILLLNTGHKFGAEGKNQMKWDECNGIFNVTINSYSVCKIKLALIKYNYDIYQDV